MSAQKRMRYSNGPMVVAVTDAIDASVGFDDDCKAMLKAACAMSLGVPADERIEIQNEVVKMIEEVLKSCVDRFEAASREADARHATLQAQLQELKAAAAECSESLTCKQNEMDHAEKELVSENDTVSTAERELKDSLGASAQANRDYSVAQQERENIEAAFNDHFKPMQIIDDAATAEIHGAHVLALGTSLPLDECLRSSLPKVCAKTTSTRTSFDNMVLSEFETVLQQQLAALTQRMAALPAVAHNIAKQERQRLETVFNDHFKPLQLTEDAEQAEVHGGHVVALATVIQLEDCVKAALPKVCVKPKSARTSFDEMVLEEFEKSLQRRLPQLSERMEANAPAAAAQDAALEAARSLVNTTKEARSTKASEFAAAADAVIQGKAGCGAAQEKIAQCHVEIETAGKDCEVAEKGLREFRAWPLECFTVLKDRVATSTAIAEAGA